MSSTDFARSADAVCANRVRNSSRSGPSPWRPSSSPRTTSTARLLRPGHPGQFAVLAVGVVVAVLGAGELVTVADHRHALGQHQRGDEVPHLPGPQFQYGGVVGLPFRAAVPGPVVALSVAVVLPVGLVVLLVVRRQVVQGEAVVAGDEVDGGQRPPPVVLVEVGRAGQPGGELRQGARLAPPQVPDRVPVLAVPLGPQGREVAHLVAALAHVPRFGDQLHLGHHRVLLDQVEERRQPVDLVELPGQGRGEVEAEAVDVHLGDPVPQRVHDQLEHVRGAHQQRVAGARGVHVVAGVVREPVVLRVVQPRKDSVGPRWLPSAVWL
ncbi:hypothetical protein SGLAM104S_04776 [Streptomyces glaucescens]